MDSIQMGNPQPLGFSTRNQGFNYPLLICHSYWQLPFDSWFTELENRLLHYQRVVALIWSHIKGPAHPAHPPAGWSFQRTCLAAFGRAWPRGAAGDVLSFFHEGKCGNISPPRTWRDHTATIWSGRKTWRGGFFLRQIGDWMGYKTGMVAYRSGIESIVSKCMWLLFQGNGFKTNKIECMWNLTAKCSNYIHPNHAGDNDLRRPPGRFIFALCALRKMVETAELLMLFLDVFKGSG